MAYGRTRRAGAGLATAVAAGLLLVALATHAVRGSGPAAADGPLTDDAVVAMLAGAGGTLPAELREALRAVREGPADLARAKDVARRMIDEGRRRGDSRLVGAAIGLLRPFAGLPDAERLYLEATARQYQHDFDGALALLDEAITLDPRAVNPLLARATILIVQGRLGEAEAECRRIAALGRAEVAFLCQSTALLLSAQAPMIYDRLAAIVARPGLLDPSLAAWAQGLMGEIAALRGQDGLALSHLGAVAAADPHAVRERLILADILLRRGRAGEVPDLLAGLPDVDGVLVRRVLAARALGGDAAADAAELGRRVEANLALGLTAHAREEALYFLQVAPDTARALDRARVNWALQHEVEDARILIDAAVAAGRPEAARPVLDWMEAEDVVVPTLRLPPGAAP